MILGCISIYDAHQWCTSRTGCSQDIKFSLPSSYCAHIQVLDLKEWALESNTICMAKMLEELDGEKQARVQDKEEWEEMRAKEKKEWEHKVHSLSEELRASGEAISFYHVCCSCEHARPNLLCLYFDIIYSRYISK